MIYLTAQPDRIKFYWQLKVQLANFVDMGIDLSNVHVLVGCDQGEPSPEMLSLEETGARCFFYPYAKDYRYISSVRPHIMRQHWARFPELQHEYIFFLDCDVIFRRLPDYSKLSLDGRWYVSDTRGYINSKYILGKVGPDGGPQIFFDMCSAVGIDPAEVIARDDQAGGCQYLLTGVTASFWRKVELDCIAIWGLEKCEKKYAALGEKKIQFWCADMWAVLWNAWIKGKTTEVTSELSFSWAHHDIATYGNQVMLHMSGVSPVTKGNEFAPHFDKLEYSHKVPFNDDFSWVSPRSITNIYIQYFNRFKDADHQNK